MLTSYLPSPSTIAPVAPAASAVYALSGETSGMALPPYAIASAASEARVENRLQGGNVTVPSRPSILEMSAAPASTGTAAQGVMQAGASPVARYSTPFLAQVIAQLPAQESSVLASQFTVEGEPTTILDVRLMDLFGQVKYKPSNASRPVPSVPPVELVMKAAEAAATREATVVRAPSSAAIMLQAANTNLRLPVASNDNRAAYLPKPEPTLVRTSGIAAYAAATRRNEDSIRVEASAEQPVAEASAPEVEKPRAA